MKKRCAVFFCKGNWVKHGLLYCDVLNISKTDLNLAKNHLLFCKIGLRKSQICCEVVRKHRAQTGASNREQNLMAVTGLLRD